MLCFSKDNKSHSFLYVSVYVWYGFEYHGNSVKKDSPRCSHSISKGTAR